MNVSLKIHMKKKRQGRLDMYVNVFEVSGGIGWAVLIWRCSCQHRAVAGTFGPWTEGRTTIGCWLQTTWDELSAYATQHWGTTQHWSDLNDRRTAHTCSQVSTVRSYRDLTLHFCPLHRWPWSIRWHPGSTVSASIPSNDTVEVISASMLFGFDAAFQAWI